MKKYLSLQTIFITLAFIILFVFVLIGYGVIDLRDKSVCSSNEERVIKTAEAIQSIYQEEQEFPVFYDDIDQLNSEDRLILTELDEKYKIDLFSFENPEEAFVYFDDNCKLQVKPTEYFVYPRY